MQHEFSVKGYSPAEMTALVTRNEIRIDIGCDVLWVLIEDWDMFLAECESARQDIEIRTVTRTCSGGQLSVLFFSVTECSVRIGKSEIRLPVTDFMNFLDSVTIE